VPGKTATDAGYEKNKWQQFDHFECKHDGCSFDCFSETEMKQHVKTHQFRPLQVPILGADGKLIQTQEIKPT
jgi:hypothetical protein